MRRENRRVFASGAGFDYCLGLQSTYCDTLRQHCETIGRTMHIVNLGESLLHAHCSHHAQDTPWLELQNFVVSAADPAAEEFQYPVSFDIRDLVTLEDVVEECQLGPNG